MALMETHYYSFSLGSNITLNVFVPTPGSSEEITQINHTQKYDYEAGLPVLYLRAGAWHGCRHGIRRKFFLSGSKER